MSSKNIFSVKITGKKYFLLVFLAFVFSIAQIVVISFSIRNEMTIDTQNTIYLCLGIFNLLLSIVGVIYFFQRNYKFKESKKMPAETAKDFNKMYPKLVTFFYLFSTLISSGYLVGFIYLYITTERKSETINGKQMQCSKYGCEGTMWMIIPFVLFIFPHCYQVFFKFYLLAKTVDKLLILHNFVFQSVEVFV